MPRKSSKPMDAQTNEDKPKARRPGPRPKSKSSDDPWMTKREAAEYLGRSYAWVSQAMRAGIIRFYKPGHNVYLLRSDLDSFITSSRRPTESPEAWIARPEQKTKPQTQKNQVMDPMNTIDIQINGEWFKAFKLVDAGKGG